jgi:hypothetical protein
MQRSANNALTKSILKMHAGDEPEHVPCHDGMHIQSKVEFNSGSSKFQTTGIGYYFQFVRWSLILDVHI